MSNSFSLGGDAAGTARCALDPEETAQAICVRCGNFMCATCTDFGRYDACPTCRALTGEVPGLVCTRDNLTFDAIWSFSWEHFKREWLMLSLSVVVLAVVLAGAGMVSSIAQRIGQEISPIAMGGLAVLGQYLQSIVQAVLMGGLCTVMYAVLRGGPADLGKLFGQFSRLGTYAVLMLVEFAVVLVPVMVVGGLGFAAWHFSQNNLELALAVGGGLGLLLIVPLLWVWLPLEYATIEVALGGETSGTQALKNAFVLASGKRLWMFLIALVSIPVVLAGMAVCCVGVLPAVALAQLLRVTLYLVLRNGSGLPPLRGQIS